VLTAGSIRSPNVWMRETLPRLLFVLANIPDGVPILVGPPPRGMLDLLRSHGIDTSRLIPVKAGTDVDRVYFANDVYVASEWPLCESENPNHLYRPVSFPLDPVRALFGGKRVPPAERQKVVMINRSGPHRRSNTEEIMRELKSRWPKVEYAVFDDSFANSRPLSDHIAMFASATVITGAQQRTARG
jgi:hypothetical protein